jgi:hypothetical protein
MSIRSIIVIMAKCQESKRVLEYQSRKERYGRERDRERARKRKKQRRAGE